ncbi:redoxin family protein [Mycobacterium xenopi 4042]|uniref:Redoxin family protein n=1 Tax=Mycobacterium xenopi 4042 TaxID=1299334 RepID=X7YV47_MYCXE|nr:redoxin family protein [Mycobacterium xenopi 4042]
MLTAWGAYGPKQMYGKTVQGVIRSTFVVDEQGKIALAQYNVKAPAMSPSCGETSACKSDRRVCSFWARLRRFCGRNYTVDAPRLANSSASAAAAFSSTPRCRLSLTLCAWVAGLRPGDQDRRLREGGGELGDERNRAAHPISTGSTPQACRNAARAAS